jgi:hypothetical protein
MFALHVTYGRLSVHKLALHAGSMSRGAFLILSKQANLVTESCDSPVINEMYRAALGIGGGARAEGQQDYSSTQMHRAGFRQFCTAIQAIAARQQQSNVCDSEMLVAFAERLRPLLTHKHAGVLPEPCMVMWEDSYVDACISSFRAQLQQPFQYYSKADRSTQQYLIDRFDAILCAACMCK